MTLSEDRLKHMDATGIDHQVLALTSSGHSPGTGVQHERRGQARDESVLGDQRLVEHCH